MSWFKVDDQSTFHSKVVRAGNSAYGAWVRMGCYCNAQLTDGVVSESVALLIASQRELDKMCEVGLIKKVGDGYEIHDYLEYQPSKADVMQKREANAKRVKRHRNAGSNGACNTITDSVTNGISTNPLLGSGSGQESDAASGSVPDRVKLDFGRLQRCWIASTGNTGMNGLHDVGVRCEEHAPLIGMNPDTYAEIAIRKFSEWVDAVPAAKRPGKSPQKFVEHFARIHELVAGKREIAPVKATGFHAPRAAVAETSVEDLDALMESK